MESHVNLVYGEVSDCLVYLPESKATILKGLRQALDTCSTWGELKVAVPSDFYHGLVMLCRPETEEGQDDGEMLPEDWEPDPSTGLTCLQSLVEDGDFPDWPEQDALTWMPKEIQTKYGEVASSILNGDYLQLRPDDAPAIVAELEQLGYRCRRDDDLVRQAKGYESAW